MQQERKVALVIQARLNSQRVPDKMIRPFAGSNLFKIALEKINSTSIPKEDIWVSVGENPLLDMAYDYGFSIYHRSMKSANSTNDPNVKDSIKLIYEWHETLLDEGYTHVVLVSACNPLLTVETIEDFYKKFTNSELNGMFSVVSKKNFYWDSEGKAITDWKGMNLMNTRKIDHIYEGAHCLYGSRIDYIKSEHWMSNKTPAEPEMFIVDDLEATDIDTMQDFNMAELLYKHYVKREI